MDKRSWPWKRKPSEKTASATDATTSNKGDQGKTKNVQISAENYAHLIEAEVQVKVLNEKLSAAQSEISTKDTLVKQHARVAEEAIAGWEKAEAEAAELKTQLESVTLLKLTAEDRASHLDDAVKECMQQIRHVKEESQQILHDTIFMKTRQWEAIKSELEERAADFEQELLKSSADNAALLRSLQERSGMLVRVSDEKSQAEAEVEVLKSGLQSCEKEISSMKYEVHVITKELEIRNEEKNMSVRLAETANRQHLEDVKKIAKMEAECQRLRGLVKKKLPGPAALAQMKLEVESLGREYGETRLRRSPAKISGSYQSYSLEDMHQCHKENEFLTAQLLATEEETKMMKEALSKRNNELHATRTICVRTASRLRSIEAQALGTNQRKDLANSNIEMPIEGSLSHIRCNPIFTSMSEDGFDEAGSCSESCSIAQMSELSELKESCSERSPNTSKSQHMELMDDFLEMEKLAFLSTESNGTISNSPRGMDVTNSEINEDAVKLSLIEENQSNLQRPTHNLASNKEPSVGNIVNDRNAILWSKLKSKVTSLFELGNLETDLRKLLEEIKRIVQDIHDELPWHPSDFSIGENHPGDATSEQDHCSNVVGEAKDGGCTDKHAIDELLKNAVSQIQDIVVPLCKEAAEIQGRSDDSALQDKATELPTSVNKVLSDKVHLDDFIFALSHMLAETRDIRLNMLACKDNESEGNGTDCIDKLTLLEKRIALHELPKRKLSGDCGILSPSSSDPANSHGVGSPGFEPQAASQNFYLEEYEQLKHEKHHVEVELARSAETSERSKLQLAEMEQHLAELKSQLAACQKSNGLAHTQLKCMAESYRSLESRTQELETEISLLRSKTEALDNELQEERHSHQDDLAKYMNLQEQFEREIRCRICLLHADAEKSKQDREIAAAAEKLAECQETMFILERQLKALQPPTESSSSSAATLRPADNLYQGEHNSNGFSLQSVLNNDDDAAASVILRTDEDDFPLDGYTSQFSASDLDSLQPMPDGSSKRPKQRSRSSSASSMSSMLSEKQGRGFSRFFSRGK